MHARFFGAYVLTFQPDFRANKVFSKKIFNEFLSLVLYFVLGLSCFFWNCNIFFLIYRSALFQIFVAAVFSTAYFFHIFAVCFCCRNVFSENRFLFTSVGLWACGISVSLCRFALYMFFMLYLSPIGAAAYVFNINVDLIFLPSYYFSVAVLLLAIFWKSANFMRRKMVVSSV